MVVALIPSLEEKEDLRLELNISTTLGISAAQAKRKLTSFLIDEVSLFFHPRAPLLVVRDEGKLSWRFPIYFAMGHYGELGHVGEIDVDAHTGEMLLSENMLEEIKANGQRLVRSATLPAVH